MTSISRRAFLGSPAIALAGTGQHESFQADPARKDLRQPQLFLDDTWIEDTYRLERVWQQADLFPEPVLRPEAPWEGRQLVLYGSAFRLGAEWRLYYMTFNPPAPSLFCMATSGDGIHWQRPNLGLFEFGGSRRNNIVMMPAPGESHDGPTVCHDPQDPQSPFKMIYYGSGRNRPRGEYAAFSSDGIVWRHRPQPVMTDTGDRTNVMSARDHEGNYVAYLRHRDMMRTVRARAIYRSQSRDFLNWSTPQLVLRQDLLDGPNTELYGMPAFRYGDLYLGMLERWYDNPDVIEVQLAWSHDNHVWHRPARRSAFIGPKYPWNQAWNTCASTPPILEGNTLYFYVGARSGAHGLEAPHSYGVVALATILAGRFAALQADFQEGLLVTRPMTWPGGELFLNSTTTRYPKAHPSSGGGTLSIAIRNEDNTPVPGFSATHNATRPQQAAWPNSLKLDTLKGRRIRLAIAMRDSRLYSFQAREGT